MALGLIRSIRLTAISEIPATYLKLVSYVFTLLKMTVGSWESGMDTVKLKIVEPYFNPVIMYNFVSFLYSDPIRLMI